VGWIKRFILFHHKQHPAEMGKPEIEQFLTALAVKRRVAASTQNQALAALLFLYKEVLARNPGWLDDIVRAKRPQRLPVVLTRPEVEALLTALDGVSWIMAIRKRIGSDQTDVRMRCYAARCHGRCGFHSGVEL